MRPSKPKNIQIMGNDNKNMNQRNKRHTMFTGHKNSVDNRRENKEDPNRKLSQGIVNLSK